MTVSPTAIVAVGQAVLAGHAATFRVAVARRAVRVGRAGLSDSAEEAQPAAERAAAIDGSL